jgi:hypothetical protein
VVSLALLFHTAVAGFVDGATAAPQVLDIFGNVVCSAHAGNASGSPDRPGRGHLPECCLLGCSLAGGHVVSPSAPAVLPVRFAERLEFVARPPGSPAGRFRHSPLNPRAPPVPA